MLYYIACKLAFEVHESTEYGLLRVRKTSPHKLLKRSEAREARGLLRHLIARDLKTCEASFCDVIENQRSGT